MGVLALPARALALVQSVLEHALAPPSEQDPRLVARVERAEQQLAHLEELLAALRQLPDDWAATCSELDDYLERIEVKRKRVAALESHAKRREQQQGEGEGANGTPQTPEELRAWGRARAQQMGLV